ncbi:uncharacterized protein L3040_008434 [Drepanopeziza brunnea f. sp. 'multigermtubi']|uniref:Dynamin n=1 Tax=Marssonina brunnea f. sp. multigermtubi (strain MB_m1) TaxID=1072389 RepID=K1WIC5_MARBU|nr:dynamin [Drepanopeziza brunnea f. sp. 'multigermtubi' MB_m1]EKD17395.1 dynamin [Drepanopeziza brunnea f. sp. 'multigermtubi' MB_m1]KAJ5035177.1 hypothetical protein L3040_008434 [Drepanopeziza brunnea f. sp. 'multigermtubi']
MDDNIYNAEDNQSAPSMGSPLDTPSSTTASISKRSEDGVLDHCHPSVSIHPIEFADFNKLDIGESMKTAHLYKKAMRLVDMYEELGLGADLKMPRFVLAGDAGCGKLSLLENLTGLPMPIATAYGTRFPIEITLLQHPRIRTRCRLSEKEGCILEDNADFKEFGTRHDYDGPMTRFQFENMLREASKIFDVPPPLFTRDLVEGSECPPAKISQHVLRVEVQSPNHKNITFWDTPGLQSDLDKSNASMAESIVKCLIEDKRTVIIAVAETEKTIESQHIFELAKEVDPEGLRTLGVHTKSDLVGIHDQKTYMPAYLRARNEEKELRHGWQAVQNCSSVRWEVPKDVDGLPRAASNGDNLFAAWLFRRSGTPLSSVGVEGLRDRFSDVFCVHLMDNFPKLNQQARDKLVRKKEELEALGPVRSSVKEQRKFLKTIVAAYQQPKSIYLGDVPQYDENPVPLYKKLASLKSAEFSIPLRDLGAVRAFQTPSMEIDEAAHLAAASLSFQGTDNIYSWINARYQSTKWNTIPGVIPPALVERLFEEQTANWVTITHGFLDMVKTMFITTVGVCLEQSCSSKHVNDTLYALVSAAVTNKMKDFQIFCKDILQNEREELQNMAGDQQLVKEIQEAKTIRLIAALSRLEAPSQRLSNPSSIAASSPKPDAEVESSQSGTKSTTPAAATATMPAATSAQAPVLGASSNPSCFNSPLGASCTSKADSPRGFAAWASSPKTFATPSTLSSGQGSVLDGSRNEDRESRKEDQESRKEDQESRKEDQESRKKDRESRKKDRESRMKDPFASCSRAPSAVNAATTEKVAPVATPVESLPSTLCSIPKPRFGEPTPLTKGPSLGEFFQSQPPAPSASQPKVQQQLPYNTSVTIRQSEPPNQPPNNPITSLAKLAKIKKESLKAILTDDRQVVYEIHDILKAYYAISSKHYIDAICKTGLNKRFVRDMMDVFSDKLIDELSDAEVKKVASETVKAKQMRRNLNNEINRLELLIRDSEEMLRKLEEEEEGEGDGEEVE